MNDTTRFSTSQKLHQLQILKNAVQKKLKAIYKFQKYKPTKLALVFDVKQCSIRHGDQIFEFIEEIEVAKVDNRSRTSELQLLKERSHKQDSLKKEVWQRVLGTDDEDGYLGSDYQRELEGAIKEAPAEQEMDNEIDCSMLAI